MRGGCLVLGDEGCKDYYHDPLKWGASNKYHAAIRCAQLIFLLEGGTRDYLHDPLKWGASNKYHAAIRCAQLIFLLEGGTRDYLHDPLRWGLQINTMQPFAALICIFFE